MSVIFIDTREIVKGATKVAALCEIEFSPSATLPTTITESFSALCEIEFDPTAEVGYEPNICNIEFDGSANISIDGSADTHLTATCEIEIEATAELVERVHLWARALIEFNGSATVAVEEIDDYQIQIIVDVVDDWGDPFSD